MKKDEQEFDELRAEYRREDFGAMVQGKFVDRMQEATNIVILDPDIAEAFPNAEAVNWAFAHLFSVIEDLNHYILWLRKRFRILQGERVDNLTM